MKDLGGGEFWNSGSYVYDRSGNITAIGSQQFTYDGNNRLDTAWMLPQATDKAETEFEKIDYAYGDEPVDLVLFRRL